MDDERALGWFLWGNTVTAPKHPQLILWKSNSFTKPKMLKSKSLKLSNAGYKTNVISLNKHIHKSSPYPPFAIALIIHTRLHAPPRTQPKVPKVLPEYMGSISLTEQQRVDSPLQHPQSPKYLRANHVTLLQSAHSHNAKYCKSCSHAMPKWLIEAYYFCSSSVVTSKQ